MKIIHCADLHLDSQMTANLTKEQARERKREIIRTFTRMVEYAEKTGVRLIMISGDLFDTRNVSALARNTVRDMICTHPQIDFLYLRGNHDSDNFLSKLEEVPDNLLLFSDTWTAYRYGNIVISGIELSENNRATVYNSLVLGHEDFNIVMMHGQAGDYACRTQAENISLNQLKNKNIDYLALGHVHTFMQDKLDNRGTWCYCGCLEGRGFDECGPKGFVLLDVDEQTCRAQMQFVQMAARTLYTLEVDVSNVMTTREAAERMEEAVKQAQYPSVDMFPNTTHVETVVLLSKGMIDSRKVKVDFSLEDMDLSKFKGKATYEQIKAYVLEKTGLKVSSLYIAQIKKKCGLDVGENFNPAKSENARQPQCTPEKEDAIMQAFRHFGII